ncbi:MAG: ATP-binding protein, partial [Nocardioides sp.]
YQLRADHAGNRFSCEVAPSVPRTVVGDRSRLLQVLHNLLDNAVKFTHEGQVDLRVRSSPTTAGGVEFVVRDTGIGIASENQDRIFGVFSQVDASVTRRYEGTGLGLAICLPLTDIMNGVISVDSEEGVGSTFTVCLPLPETDSGSSGDAEVQLDDGGRAGTDRRAFG